MQRVVSKAGLLAVKMVASLGEMTVELLVVTRVDVLVERMAASMVDSMGDWRVVLKDVVKVERKVD